MFPGDLLKIDNVPFATLLDATPLMNVSVQVMKP
jgi:hypothetical protein